MYGVWLTGLLAITAAGVNRMQSPAAPACVIDAAEDDVAVMLSRPDRRGGGAAATVRPSSSGSGTESIGSAAGARGW